MFTVRLTEDFMGAGTQGQTVEVELDLFDVGQVRIGRCWHTAQLLVGPHVLGEAFGKWPAAAAREQAAAAE
jgi:hypothetical protein